MKLVYGALCVAGVGLALPPNAAGGFIPPYLMFSTSDTSAWQHTTEPWNGDKTFYLWFLNYSTSELQFDFTGSLQIVSFVTVPGVQNVGTLMSPQILFDAGCADPGMQYETLLGAVTVRDPDGSGGSACFAQSQSTGRFCFRDCTPQGYWWDLYPHGIQTLLGDTCGLPPSAPDCLALSVDGGSWGQVKARYR